MIRASSLLPCLLVIGVAAAAVPWGSPFPRDPGDRRDRLAQISQRLAAGESAAIDELLACTQPVSPDAAPSSAEIERLRQDVERLRAASRAAPTAPDPRAASPGNAEASVREARAWLRAGDPIRCLKALSPATASGVPLDGEVAFWRACALERLGRDAEALDQYRRAADTVVSPVLKQAAASGVDHVEWRLRRAGGPEAKS